MAEGNSLSRGGLAEVMAAYMRGEIQPEDFHKKTAGADKYADPAAETIAEELWYHYNDLKTKPVSLSAKAWNQFARWIAFLRTDFELEEKWPRLVKIPVWVPVVLLLILAVSWRFEFRVFFLVWFLIGVAWSFMVYVRDQKNLLIRNTDPEFQQAVNFAPFLSEEDWQVNRHLLDDYNLPEYSPEMHGGPDRDDLRPQTRDLVIFIIMVFLPLVLLYAIVSDQRFKHFHIFQRRKEDASPACETNA